MISEIQLNIANIYRFVAFCVFSENKNLFGNVDEIALVKFYVETEHRLMSGLEMLSHVRTAQIALGVHDKTLCPDEYSVFLGCERISWLLEYWGRVANPTFNPPLSKDSAGFFRDSKGRSALHLTPGVIFGIDGIQYLKCGCKPQIESPTNCTNCQCVKRRTPCSIFCCCKGRCNNSIAPDYMVTKSLFKDFEKNPAMDVDNVIQEDEDLNQSDNEVDEIDENEGRLEDDKSLAQTDSDDEENDFGGDQDDDEL
jgi:hypothetical protein